MEITISEFRKNIKGYFDSALNDQMVCIERGGIHFNLTARLPKGLDEATNIKENSDGTISPIDSKKPSSFTTAPFVKLKSIGTPVELEVTGLPDLLTKPRGNYKLPTGLVSRQDGNCKIHGLPLDDRGRCLQKGCKYA